ncbi:MAG: ribonuclease J [Gracilibacter sp. BRH_c7a]|nr:MAG: ribonuclease J [Gracilibacter sp. BRH_c7a]
MTKENKLQIIPLGGLGEIGKNMTVIRYNNKIIIVDAGLAFPDEEMLGIDIVLPDYSYLIDNRDLIAGVIITHGHEDHIGSLPYLLKDLDVPVYGTRLSIGMIQSKLRESKVSNATLNVVKPRDTIKLGVFRVEFINGSHSIPGSVGLAIHTPLGTIVHTGDFKLDHTPVSGEILDLHKFSELGDKGVLCLLSDSTNVERPGFTASERLVGENIDEAFFNAKERIIFASFASNVNRLQQAVTAAVKYNRKVAVVGRSMINVVGIAEELGYLDIPEGCLIEVERIMDFPGDRVCILTTGSQGEPMSALSRMATGEHRQISINEGDTVIVSASPIPGNEKAIARNIDHLLRLGAKVIYESVSGMHVSGHASEEELKLMLSMVKPKYFIPVHGEYRMLVKHAQLAQLVGVERDNIFIAENGSVIEFTRHGAKIAENVPAGRVLIDGLGIGDVGNIVLRDRKQLSQDGILIAVVTISRSNGAIMAGPDIVTRGFVYVRDSEEMIHEVKDMVRETLMRCQEEGIHQWATLKNRIKDMVSKHLYQKTGRRPMIIPIIQEIKN